LHPGWAGDSWAKWLTSVRVLDREHDGCCMKSAYRLPRMPIGALAPSPAVLFVTHPTAPQRLHPAIDGSSCTHTTSQTPSPHHSALDLQPPFRHVDRRHIHVGADKEMLDRRDVVREARRWHLQILGTSRPHQHVPLREVVGPKEGASKKKEETSAGNVHRSSSSWPHSSAHLFRTLRTVKRRVPARTPDPRLA